AQVLEEVGSLVQADYKDIMLLGQNVNSYRGDVDFPTLLEKCASFEGDYWVRFMTSHPKDASPALVRVMAEQPKVAKHFHLPFQSGNDRILSAMNRKYNREQYLEKALAIKEQVQDVSLTSDVIVGFPTETEKEFLDTVELVKQVGFDMLYTFIYSPRKGTVAEKMEGRIPHEEQVRRFSYLSDVQNEIAQRNNDAFVGKVLTVLSEGVNEKGIPTGRSSGNKIVTFDAPVPRGTFCKVKIDTARQYALSGSVQD
ncbi:MAG: MiaB/RimO family radical SAM methylthiotransferase, partial [Clostridia bacterium]|nr:MiaB/RimO family radical SAM methylthiotransferase [Clostridia bacterium]